ncbi:MAG: 30S ribosomal protein S6 [Oligoflexales bacterium]|nr:30S ribosomal protein S6 [Oligoflexales bacterium]
MLREYEFTVIFGPQLQDEESKKLQKKYETILLGKDGELIKKSDWGSRKLAFAMKGQYKGRYVHYDLTTTPDRLAEAERLMRIDEGVLRYLSVRVGENIDVEARKLELAKAEAQAAAQREASASLL